MLPRVLAVCLLVALALPVGAGAAPTAAPSIVGGRDADIADWPSIAFVLAAWDVDGDGELDDGASCTGTVIKPEWILTAAHCGLRPDGGPVDAMLAITGAADYEDPLREELAADRLVVHDRWDPETLLGDAMLMHLEAPSSRPAMPLALAGTTYGLDPTVPNAAGWGFVDEDATLETTVLQEAFLAIDDDACAGEPDFDLNSQTCAYTPNVAGVCHGDSGGPLTVLDQAGTPHLWGITGYGAERPPGTKPCALTVPAVFSWVPAFAGWIETTTTAAAPPTPPPPGTPPPAPQPLPATPRDTTAPVLRGARLSRTRLRAARRGATISRRGARLSFSLSEAAAVRVSVVKRGRALRPSALFAAQAGRTRKTFSGRLGGRRLAPGRYRLRLRAVDAAGNAGKAVAVRFRIVP